MSRVPSGCCLGWARQGEAISRPCVIHMGLREKTMTSGRLRETVGEEFRVMVRFLFEPH